MKQPTSFLLVILLSLVTSTVYSSTQQRLVAKAAGCQAATAQRDLDINNVRTTILNGGDMWWNLNNARYEVPKVEQGQVSKNALSAGALWYGAVTNGNLRLACQSYRQQNNNNIYPGPLVDGTAYIDEQTCKQYNRIWAITLTDLNTFRNQPKNWSNPGDEIASWPCMGTVAGGAKYLAPFVDRDYDGIYNPLLGDYPSFEQNIATNIPDMMLFWINNDKGNIHSASSGLPIGLEMHSFAFAYKSNDELNNTTFYKTTIFHRGSEVLDSFIFAQWADPSIGNPNDDYVQFDANRNLVIAYNGDDNDEGVWGYELNPPSVGIRMLEGPTENGKAVPIRSFIAYDNDFSARGNPSRPEHYWSYMNARWKNGTHLTYGGNGMNHYDTCSIMYPGFTDPEKRWEWTENTDTNIPGDRRTLVSYAPFSLLPGAVNTISYAVVWARANTGGATGSLNMLKTASDKAFNLYQHKFVFTATNELKGLAKNISVYPNPGNEFIVVNDPSAIVTSIDFYSISGKKISNQPFYNNQQINTDMLEAGIYFYSLKTATGETVLTGKWLKR